MHTVESAVLVPLGIGLICIFLMLTFYLHDRTVLTAESAAQILTWQSGPEGQTPDRDAAQARLSEGLLITEVRVEELEADNTVFSLRTARGYRLFERALNLFGAGIGDREEGRVTAVRINPFWMKRIWKAVEE